MNIVECLLDDMDTVPQGHERDSKEKAKGSAKFSDKRGPRVDWHLCFHIGVVGHRNKAEQKVVRFISRWDSISFDPVLQIVAGLETTRLLVDPIKVFHEEIFIKLLISPTGYTIKKVLAKYPVIFSLWLTTCTVGE